VKVILTTHGVRQGSVLSPILFSVFISGVVEEWKRAGIGVTIGSRRFGGLLFADDIVLIADSVSQLHKALRVMDRHAGEWKYRFNVGKCAVVAMHAGRSGPTGEAWRLQGQSVVETRDYKYLGVHMQSDSKWHAWHDARIKKGKRVLPTMWYSGARQGALTT